MSAHAVSFKTCCTRIEEYRPQDWPYTRCPSCGECHTNDKRAKITSGFILQMYLFISCKKVELEYSHNIKTKKDYQYTSNHPYNILIAQQYMPDESC